ncbi:hypothetical protein CA951_42135, partial [Rhodococcus sp. NCIMB 12038]
MASTNWHLVQYTTNGTNSCLGFGAGGVVRAAPAPLVSLDTMAVLKEWPRHSEFLTTLDIDTLEVVENATLLAPVTYPNTVLCAGVNY